MSETSLKHVFFGMKMNYSNRSFWHDYRLLKQICLILILKQVSFGTIIVGANMSHFLSSCFTRVFLLRATTTVNIFINVQPPPPPKVYRSTSLWWVGWGSYTINWHNIDCHSDTRNETFFSEYVWLKHITHIGYMFSQITVDILSY